MCYPLSTPQGSQTTAAITRFALYFSVAVVMIQMGQWHALTQKRHTITYRMTPKLEHFPLPLPHILVHLLSRLFAHFSVLFYVWFCIKVFIYMYVCSVFCLFRVDFYSFIFVFIICTVIVLHLPFGTVCSFCCLTASYYYSSFFPQSLCKLEFSCYSGILSFCHYALLWFHDIPIFSDLMS